MESSSLGVVFDLDGVLINSHDQHRDSWFALAKELGKPMSPEMFKASFGMRNESCIPKVFGWTDQDDTASIAECGERKEELYRELLRRDGLESLPGVVKLLSELKERKVPVSLGSSTSRKNIEAVFDGTGLGHFFGDNYTGAEDVTQGKPAPDVFLLAAQKIDRPAGNCVVIEDAHVGLEAAAAAGMRGLGVATTHSAEALSTAQHDRIVESLEEVDVASLLALFA